MTSGGSKKKKYDKCNDDVYLLSWNQKGTTNEDKGSS